MITRNLDVALIRRVRVRQAVTAEVRAEIFNALNAAALGHPNGAFGTAAFGSVTSAGDPPVVQVALKLHF